MEKHYRIAFTGLGSIARRHICNVVALLDARGCTYEIDLYRTSLQKPLPEGMAPLVHAVHMYADPIPHGKEYDVVFVTNPTSLHLDAVLKFAPFTKAFFIEKPVFDTAVIDASVYKIFSEKVCYVACPLRYNSVLGYVRDYIDLASVISARAISSSYLPDWRPGQDYRDCYSAHRSMGGGVGIDLIHEWDYLTWLFGMPQECHSILCKLSPLEIDSDDLAIYIARTERTAIEVHLDYFGRKPVRTLDLFLPDDTVHCDLLAGEICYLKGGKTVCLNGDRNSFQKREIEHFFRIVNREIVNDSTPEHALEVLSLTSGNSNT